MLQKSTYLILSFFIFFLFSETHAQQFIFFHTATDDSSSGLIVLNQSGETLLEINAKNKITARGEFEVRGTSWFQDSMESDGFVTLNNSGCYSGTWSQCSDFRLKKNINSIPNALNRTLSLNGVSFNWLTDEFPEFNFEEGSNLGFIAQDVEDIFPELVRTEKNGYKSIAYDNLTPVLVEAIKEQQIILNNQSDEINILKSELIEQKKEIESIKELLKKESL